MIELRAFSVLSLHLFDWFQKRRGGRVAEGARLESVFRVKPNVGSNPTLSAIYSLEKIANFKIINRIKYLTTQTRLHKSSENISEYFWVFQNFATDCYNFCYTQFSGTEFNNDSLPSG